MKDTIAEKLLVDPLVDGQLKPDSEVGLKIHVLTRDATGTRVSLKYEAVGLPRVKACTAVSYYHRKIIQTDSRNADDHRFSHPVHRQRVRSRECQHNFFRGGVLSMAKKNEILE